MTNREKLRENYNRKLSYWEQEYQLEYSRHLREIKQNYIDEILLTIIDEINYFHDNFHITPTVIIMAQEEYEILPPTHDGEKIQLYGIDIIKSNDINMSKPYYLGF